MGIGGEVIDDDDADAYEEELILMVIRMNRGSKVEAFSVFHLDICPFPHSCNRPVYHHFIVMVHLEISAFDIDQLSKRKRKILYYFKQLYG